MPYGIRSNSALLAAIIERLKHSNRLLVVDEAHFLKWEGFETVRRIHDAAGVGIVFLGQDRLYDQMKGTAKTSFLFDQICSRIAIRRHLTTIQKSDVKLVSNSICPDLPPDCIDLLYKRALEPGRFRTIANLLTWVIEIHKTKQIPIDVDLFREVTKFLII